MKKLAFKELLAEWRLWLGFFLVLILSSTLIISCCVMLYTAVFSNVEELTGSLMSLASIFIIANAFAAWATLDVVMKQVISLQRKNHALWIQAGASPAQISKTIYVQAFASMAICFVIAIGFAVPFCIAGIKRINKGSLPVDEDLNQKIDRLNINFGPLTFITAFLVMALLCYLGTRIAANRAKNTQVMDIVRNSDSSDKKPAMARLLAGIVMVLATVALGFQVFKPFGGTMYLGIVMVGAMIPFLAWIVPVIVNVLAKILGATKTSSWYIATRSARYYFNSTTAAITLLYFSATIASVFVQSGDLARTVGLAQGLPERAFKVQVQPLIYTFGGPVLLVALAAGISVFIASKTRGKELATVQAAGASGKQVLTATFCETLIYVITAGIISMVVTLIHATFGYFSSMATFRKGHWSFAWQPSLIVLAGGFIVMLIAALVPTYLNLKKPITQVINS